METIILTSENIHMIGTSGVGFTKQQLKLLGVQLPAKKGWIKDLVGTQIDARNYRKAMSLCKDNKNRSNAKETAQHSNPKLYSKEAKILKQLGKKNLHWKVRLDLEYKLRCIQAYNQRLSGMFSMPKEQPSVEWKQWKQTNRLHHYR